MSVPDAATRQGWEDYQRGYEAGQRDALSVERLAGIDGCIAIVEQSLATVRAEFEDNPESRSMATSVAAREHVVALLTGYRNREAALAASPSRAGEK